jgi:hypothetical protein
VQSVYMAAVSELRSADDENEKYDTMAEIIPLRLPSAIPKSLWPSDDIANMEKRLRIAQANDALCDIRRLLRVCLGLWEYKYTQLGPSQRAGTRARTLIKRFQDKIDRAVETYRAARTALLVLDPGGLWSQNLLELKPADVKGPGRKENESEGRRELSWIWMVNSGPDDLSATLSEEEIGDCEFAQQWLLMWSNTHDSFTC